jgi:transcriptional regulator with XRE-family HTH domain
MKKLKGARAMFMEWSAVREGNTEEENATEEQLPRAEELKKKRRGQREEGVGTIGEKIFRLRRSNGLSQGEFGRKMGVSRQTISKWELGKAQPERENIEKMTEIYSLPADYFELEKDENIPATEISATEIPATEGAAAEILAGQGAERGKKWNEPIQITKEKLLLAGTFALLGGLLVASGVLTSVYCSGFFVIPLFFLNFLFLAVAAAFALPTGIYALVRKSKKLAVANGAGWCLLLLLSVATYFLAPRETVYPVYAEGERIEVRLEESELYYLQGENTLIFTAENFPENTEVIYLRVASCAGEFAPQSVSMEIYGVDRRGEKYAADSVLWERMEDAYSLAVDFGQDISYEVVVRTAAKIGLNCSWSEEK